MEIIGKNIPSLQSAIASGFESVASGIQQSTQVKGPEAIKSAFESFSSAQIGTFGSADLLPIVADIARFPDPVQYFQSQPKSSTPAGSKFDSREFADVINEKNFNPLKELSHFGENSLFQNVSDTNATLDLGDGNWKEVSELLFGLFKKTPLQEGGVSFNKAIKESATQIAGRDIQGPPEPEMIYPNRGIFNPNGKELKQEAPGSGVKNNLNSDFVPLKSAIDNSSEAEQSGIIIVGGKVPSGDKTEMNRVKVPPKPIVPHPEPAQLGGSGVASGSTGAGYGPAMKGSVKQNEVIEEAMAHKHSFTGIEPEYLPGESNEGIPPGGHSPGTELNKKLGDLEPLVDKTVQGSAEQNESVQDAMEKATSTDEKIMNPYHPKGIVGLVYWGRIFQSKLTAVRIKLTQSRMPQKKQNLHTFRKNPNIWKAGTQ